jgi:hypothetical protein
MPRHGEGTDNLYSRAGWLRDTSTAAEADILQLVQGLAAQRVGGTADAFETPAEIAAYERRLDA